jgi:hypothetical protein
MENQQTIEQCKKRLFKIGIKLGASPKLISTRLLSTDDKKDMVEGHLDDVSLETAVEVWIKNKIPDYANGKTEPYRPKY